MKLKMEDIAKMANVSKSAVSLAINGKDGVSQETREKIFKIIEEQGYKPLKNRHKGKSHKLINVNFIIVNNDQGMVTSSFRSLPFFDSLVSTISKRVADYGGKMQINILSGQHLERDLTNMLKELDIQGAIVLGTEMTEETINMLKGKLKKVVFVDTYYPGVLADFVTMDNFQGAYQAVKYIVNKGYKRIGYAASSQLIPNFSERRRGFYQALKDLNMKINDQDFFTISPIKLLPDQDEIDQILKRDLPEAIFCEDDYIAIRLIRELKLRKIKVPSDVAIMGFDDIYGSTLISPQLTTIHVPVEQICDQVLYQLQCQVADKNWQSQKCLVSTRVIARESL